MNAILQPVQKTLIQELRDERFREIDLLDSDEVIRHVEEGKDDFVMLAYEGLTSLDTKPHERLNKLLKALLEDYNKLSLDQTVQLCDMLREAMKRQAVREVNAQLNRLR